MMTMSVPLLEVRNIKKYFSVSGGFLAGKAKTVRAVDNVSLALPQGESVGLIGESGSGKTTLGRLMMKLMPCDDGRIFFEGEDISRYSQRMMQPIRQKMQMVFQDPFSSLDPRLTVRRIIEEGLTLQNSLLKKDREEKIRTVLSSVNLPKDAADYFPHEFSGGERQRIAIARALIVDPSLLILDEAVSSLDVLVQEQILKLLGDLRKRFNLTFLFISHNLRVVQKLTTQVAVMYQGKIVESAPMQEMMQNPLRPYTQRLLSAAINYQVTDHEKDFSISETALWREAGNGHFVLS